MRFDPWKNTKLEGLYATKAGLVTQCEAEGFRHITYFIDRPDVMAKYSVTLCADKARFPRLLANGNLVAQGPGVPEGWFASAGLFVLIIDLPTHPAAQAWIYIIWAFAFAVHLLGRACGRDWPLQLRSRDARSRAVAVIGR